LIIFISLQKYCKSFNYASIFQKMFHERNFQNTKMFPERNFQNTKMFLERSFSTIPPPDG